MRLLVVLLATLLVLVGVAVPAQKAAAATATAPESCGAAELAPLLVGDHIVPRPVPGLVPIILLHGWLGTARHEQSRVGTFSRFVDLVSPDEATQQTSPAQRSLLGMFQQLRGAAVYTFDYRDLAARWVTDPGIGDALASSLTCLATATRHRVIVVAHSMGGLAARQALSESMGGVPVASMVSDVLTFGTPNTGSDVAARLGQMVDSTGTVRSAEIASLEPEGRLGLSALLASCGEAVSEDATRAGACTGVPMIDALTSQAGVGLRTGSVELRSLPPWPPSVHVLALVGDIQVTAAVVLGARMKPVDLGDIMVATGSAEAGVDDYIVSTCRYTLLDLPDLRAAVAELNPLARLGDALRFSSLVVAVDASPCHHAKLTRNVDLVSHATAAVARVVDDQLEHLPSTRTLLHSPLVPCVQESWGCAGLATPSGVPRERLTRPLEAHTVEVADGAATRGRVGAARAALKPVRVAPTHCIPRYAPFTAWRYAFYAADVGEIPVLPGHRRQHERRFFRARIPGARPAAPSRTGQNASA